eukprot:1283017-Rhodomonas_salina.3
MNTELKTKNKLAVSKRDASTKYIFDILVHALSEFYEDLSTKIALGEQQVEKHENLGLHGLRFFIYTDFEPYNSMFILDESRNNSNERVGKTLYSPEHGSAITLTLFQNGNQLIQCKIPESGKVLRFLGSRIATTEEKKTQLKCDELFFLLNPVSI